MIRRPGSAAGFLLAACLVLQPLVRPCDSRAATTPSAPEQAAVPWHRDLRMDWAGHLKARGSASWPADDSLYALVGTGTYLDGSLEGRLTNRLFLGRRAVFETHYEMVLNGGDTRRKTRALENRFPALASYRLPSGAQLEDDRRLMDLTASLAQSDGCVLYHRLDRLYLSLFPSWGIVSIGRQALTWGNGLLFNPMDLFNPFAPTDIERDYKVGDDMVVTQINLGTVSQVQALCVPRRDPATGNIESSQSSLAVKYHVSWGVSEFDLMAARHYGDQVLGLGGTGYLGAAAWRFDTVLTLSGDTQALSLAANIDYSWIWGGKNVYGFLEAYYNSLGGSDYTAVLTDPRVLERLERGELFTLGRVYLAGSVRAELHPLLNVYLTMITNLQDPSSILQPRVVWDMTRDLQFTLGAGVAVGGNGTEYGGFPAPGSNLNLESPPVVFLWLTRYF